MIVFPGIAKEHFLPATNGYTPPGLLSRGNKFRTGYLQQLRGAFILILPSTKEPAGVEFTHSGLKPKFHIVNSYYCC